MSNESTGKVFFVAAALNAVGLVSWIWMRPPGGLRKA